MREEVGYMYLKFSLNIIISYFEQGLFMSEAYLYKDVIILLSISLSKTFWIRVTF